MTWVRVAPLTDLPEEGGLRFDSGEHRVAIFRVEDDVYAIGDRCSHAEASLSEGEVFDTEVECPLHGSVFDMKTGDPQSLPATRPVPTYDVKVADGVIFLQLEST